MRTITQTKNVTATTLIVAILVAFLGGLAFMAVPLLKYGSKNSKNSKVNQVQYPVANKKCSVNNFGVYNKCGGRYSGFRNMQVACHNGVGTRLTDASCPTSAQWQQRADYYCSQVCAGKKPTTPSSTPPGPTPTTTPSSTPYCNSEFFLITTTGTPRSSTTTYDLQIKDVEGVGAVRIPNRYFPRSNWYNQNNLPCSVSHIVDRNQPIYNATTMPLTAYVTDCANPANVCQVTSQVVP